MLGTESYIAVNEVQRQTVKWTLDKYFPLVEQHQGGGVVMDIGCGPGDITTELLLPKLTSLRQLVAVDKNDITIKFAKSNFSHEKVQYIVMDISKDVGKEFEEKFDQIYSFFCLQWVEDYRNVLQNINRCLRPGGTVLLSFVADCPQNRAYALMSQDEYWSKYTINYSMNYYNRDDAVEDFTKLLKSTNFEVHTCELVTRHHVYDNEEGIKDFCRVINPIAVSKEVESGYWEEVMRHIRNHDRFPSMQQDGRCLYHLNVLIVVAIKI